MQLSAPIGSRVWVIDILHKILQVTSAVQPLSLTLPSLVKTKVKLPEGSVEVYGPGRAVVKFPESVAKSGAVASGPL